MECAFDYNSLSEQVSKLRSELNETVVSLDKLNSYRSYVPSEFKKQPSKQVKRHPSEASSPEKDGSSSYSDSEESTSDDDQPSKKVALQSIVTAKVESSKTRKKFIHTYISDNKNQLRNRRFLGMVQNTLQKFRDEEVKRRPQDLKRKKAIEKVEAAVEDEKNSVKRQKAELISKSKHQQMELECFEKMMRIAKSFEEWKNNQENLLNFIGTKTKPRIFFLPRSLSPNTKKLLEKSRTKTMEKIQMHKADVDEVLLKIKESYDLPVPTINVEDNNTHTSNSDDTNISECILRPEVTNEEARDTEEVLQLDVSENECEDFD